MSADERSILTEPHRLASLEASGLLDSAPEASFDRYTRLAARLLDADVALVALVSGQRQLVKSAVGLPPEPGRERVTSLALSLCRRAVDRREPVVLEDLARAPIEEAGPAREALGPGAYAGVPLLAGDGRPLGSFGVLARRPRRWSEADLELLEDLASAVSAEIDLRRRKARFRELLASAPIALVVHSAEGIHYANARAAALVGLETPGALVGRTVAEFVHPDERETAAGRTRRLLEEGAPLPVARYRLVAADGTLRHVEVRSVPAVHDGRPAVQTALLDVTEEVRARRELEEARRRQEILLQQLPTVLWTVDRDLRFTSSVGAGLEGLGIDPGQAVGQTLGEYFGTDDPDFLPIRRHREALGGRPAVYSFEWEGRIFDVRVEPLRGEGGEVQGVVGSAVDVTDRVESERELRTTEGRYRTLFEENVAGVLRATLEGRILEANRAAARMFGYESAEDMKGLPARSVYMRPEEREAFVRDIRREGRLTGRSYLGRRADGSAIPFLASSSLIEDPETGRTQVVATLLDMTERHRMEQALQASEERYRRIFEDSNDAIYVTDRDGSIVEVNPAFERLFGYPRRELLRMNAADFYRDERDRERFQRIIEGSGHVEDFEVGLLASGERALECVLSATLRTNDRGEVVGYQGIIRDVSERKLFEEELERRALHDPLTGLPNRTLFFDRLEQAVARTRRAGDRIAVAFLDLDRFKAVNDSLGHSAGDQVLAEVARRLQGAVRASDTVARMGGDEFTVLLEGLEDEEEAVEAAIRIGRSLRAPVAAGGEEVHLTVSVGLAHAGGPGAAGAGGAPSRAPGAPDPVSAEELIRRADAAMFRAKDLRGTRVQAYDPELDAAETARIQRENELRGALERGEFVLHYQPIVALASGRIVAVEPLVRWRHAERGLLAPGEFLPLAEESGLILPLGAWVLRRALKEVTRWREAADASGASGASDPPLVLSVNLSPAQFEDPGLLPLVESQLEELAVPPRLLQLEVTEHTMMRTPDRARQLSRLGVAIAIDDFGTGYSSLRYVRELEADALKIDRSFVAGLGRDGRDEAIVTTILALGRSLDLDVVAEGVETDEQIRWLRAAGCPAAQGFRLARPLPPGELERLLEEGIELGGGSGSPTGS